MKTCSIQSRGDRDFSLGLTGCLDRCSDGDRQCARTLCSPKACLQHPVTSNVYAYIYIYIYIYTHTHKGGKGKSNEIERI